MSQIDAIMNNAARHGMRLSRRVVEGFVNSDKQYAINSESNEKRKANAKST